MIKYGTALSCTLALLAVATSPAASARTGAVASWTGSELVTPGDARAGSTATATHPSVPGSSTDLAVRKNSWGSNWGEGGD